MANTRLCGPAVLGMLFLTVGMSLGTVQPVPAQPREVPPPIVHVSDWTLTPAQIDTNCTRALAAFKRRVERLVTAPGRPTATSFLEPFETANADLNDTLVAETMLFQVSSDERVRAASQRCNALLNDAGSEIAARPDLYRALVAVKAGGTAHTDAQRRLLTLDLTAALRAGAGLNAEARKEFVALQKRLDDVQLRYAANLGRDTTTIALLPSQRDGLSDDFIARLKRDASGNLVVPVNESTVGPFLRTAADPEARKAFYIAYARRGGTGNVALLEEAIRIRDRLAKLMGAPNWAAYTLADRMAQSPQRVNTFLADIDRALLPVARAEKEELAQLKGGSIEPWDTAFYANRLRKARYDVDNDVISQYFPVQHTIDAVLGVYAKLFDVRFRLNTTMPRWSPDVIAYDVSESSGRYLGSFYLDLYPRPGKYSHFADFPFAPHRRFANGTEQAPLGAIIGNWPQPAAGHPALLTHGEVQTFFHEFGHNMAEMFANSPYESLTGFRRDFVEAPSQMLENWVWNPAILKEISANATTGEPLPDDVIAKMIRARNFRAASDNVTQVFYATVDMRYHTQGANVDTTALWRTTLHETTPGEMLPDTYPQASFGHLMGGYDAGYYGYLWSKVYAQDLFTAFERDGLENPLVGGRYRKLVLEPALTDEADAEVGHFLGRPMRPDAFYRELGISVPR